MLQNTTKCFRSVGSIEGKIHGLCLNTDNPMLNDCNNRNHTFSVFTISLITMHFLTYERVTRVTYLSYLEPIIN